jgi:hypothetical protein
MKSYTTGCVTNFHFHFETRNNSHTITKLTPLISDSIMKPLRSNGPSSIYHCTVIIPYVKAISEKFRRIGNRFNFKTIFKTKHTLRVGHWWKLDRLEMPSRQSSVCTISHVTVADVISTIQADLLKYALCSTNITRHKVCSKNQN